MSSVHLCYGEFLKVLLGHIKIATDLRVMCYDHDPRSCVQVQGHWGKKMRIISVSALSCFGKWVETKIDTKIKHKSWPWALVNCVSLRSLEEIRWIKNYILFKGGGVSFVGLLIVPLAMIKILY